MVHRHQNLPRGMFWFTVNVSVEQLVRKKLRHTKHRLHEPQSLIQVVDDPENEQTAQAKQLVGWYFAFSVEEGSCVFVDVGHGIGGAEGRRLRDEEHVES
jgi:hypothetical protein